MFRHATCATLLAALLLVGAGLLRGAQAEEAIQLIAEDDWFPYAGKVDGKAAGFAVDLVRAAYAAEGRAVVFKSMPFARCMEEVLAGTELGCFDTVIQPDNSALYLFHQTPLFAATIVIVAPVDSGEHDLTYKDLQGKNVAATIGYTYGEPFQSDASIDKDFVQSDVAILRLVANKRADYGVIFDMVLNNLVAEHADQLAGKVKVVGTLSRQDLYVSFSLRRPDAKAAAAMIDRGLVKIKEDGTYRRIEASWQSRILTQ